MKPAQWSDLPDELLSAIYLKITGLLHRVRFAVACRSWRAAAIGSRHQVPPALPWFVYSDCKDDHDHDHHNNRTKCVYCPEDGGVLRIRLPSEAIDKDLVGSYDDGWVVMKGPNLQLAAVNLFSGIEVPLPENNMRSLRKVVFSESPTSNGCIIAVTHSNGIALCGIGYLDNGWRIKRTDGLRLVDIIFYNGQLYGITTGQLLKFEIGENKAGGPVIIGEPRRLQIRMCNAPFVHPNYIVELHGKLALVARTWHGISGEPSFRVFKLVDDSTTGNAGMWEEVMSLGDCALFLGGKWSKAVYIPTTGRNEVQRSYVYADDATYLTSFDGHGDIVCPLQKSNSVMPRIKSVGSYEVVRSPGMWILPPNFLPIETSQVYSAKRKKKRLVKCRSFKFIPS
ncbi:hypothetical protein VPH35_102833 [Triticum aestivum]